jgi:RNA polymerase primary sigma factor
MDLADQTRKILATLTPREEKVLRMRFGISDRTGAPGPDETASVEVIETFMEEPEIIEAPPPKKVKHSTRKHQTK